MRVERPIGHDALVEGLLAAAGRGRLPHAFVFEGPPGIGKFEAAKWFAQGLLCAEGPGPPCRSCGPCRRVESGDEASNHPDLFRIDPVVEGVEAIKIDRIVERDGSESAAGFLRLKPLEGGWRVVLVREADRMLVQAQNALLKTLEEPRPGTLLLLETARPERLLATILSRCVRVRLEPLAPEGAARVLAANGIEGASATELSRWSAGSPGEALRLARQGAAGVRACIAAALAGKRDPVAAAAEAWEVEGEFGGDTARAEARERARAGIDLCLAVVADLQRGAAGVEPGGLRHGDLVERGPGHAATFGTVLEELLEARQDVDRNLAPDAVLERAFEALGPLAPAAERSGGRSARRTR